MKAINLLISALMFTALVSCKSQSKVQNEGPQKTDDPTVYKGVTDSNCAVEVSFGSYGSGIDGKAYEKVLALIETNKLASSGKSLGREGETRICLPLTELKGSKKTEFIDQLKKIAKEAQLVSVSIR